MLKTISLNYFWFLLSHILMLIVYTFSFYSLLPKNATNSSTKYNDREDQYFYMNPHTPVKKTFVMMTGELEVDSIVCEMVNSSTYFHFCLWCLLS